MNAKHELELRELEQVVGGVVGAALGVIGGAVGAAAVDYGWKKVKGAWDNLTKSKNNSSSNNSSSNNE